MKFWKAIWFLLFAAFLASCSSRESQEMEAALEQATAVYGDGSLEMEVDTVLFIPGLSEAPAYFAKKRQYDKAALAALLNGYSEKDFNKEAAMLSFKEAEHYGELAQDSLTVARAEYWMGKFLYEEGRKEDALMMLKSSKNNSSNCRLDKAIIENSLATVYILLYQLDSAETCLQNSLFYAQNRFDDFVEWKVLNNYSVLYRIQGKYDKALNCLRGIDNSCISNVEKALIFLNFGNIYMAWNKIDSASYYYRCLDELLTIADVKNDTKVSAYGALLRFSKKQSNDSLALVYLDKHERALYEVMLQGQEHAVYRIQKQYDYEALQNTMNKKIIQRHRIILMFGVLLLSSTIIILVLQHRHKKMIVAEEIMQQQLNALKESLQLTVKSSTTDKIILSWLRLIIVANHTTKRHEAQKNDWLSVWRGIMSGKETNFEAAQEIIEMAYPGLFTAIINKYPDLTETETKVCLLSCFDLSNSEMAELLELSTNTVNQNRSILRKKLCLKSEKMPEQLRIIFSK